MLLRPLFCLAAALLLSAQAHAPLAPLAPLAARPAKAAARAHHVIVVSFDGGKPSVMKESEMPLTMTMAKEGAASWSAQTTFPSITLTSHTSMLTGVGPAKHKVLWNDWVPNKGLIKSPSVFKLAREAGYPTALFAGKEKFRHLNIMGTIDEFQVPSYSALVVAQRAAKYIVEKKPNLCFVHFADSDGAGHEFGWGSEQQKKAFALEDKALQMLRDAVKEAGIEKRATFMLSADHGGHDKTHGSNSPEDMTIPWIAWGANVKAGALANAPTTYDTAATALWLLDVPVPEDWDGKPVEAAFNEVK